MAHGPRMWITHLFPSWAALRLRWRVDLRSIPTQIRSWKGYTLQNKDLKDLLRYWYKTWLKQFKLSINDYIEYQIINPYPVVSRIIRLTKPYVYKCLWLGSNTVIFAIIKYISWMSLAFFTLSKNVRPNIYLEGRERSKYLWQKKFFWNPSFQNRRNLDNK